MVILEQTNDPSGQKESILKVILCFFLKWNASNPELFQRFQPCRRWGALLSQKFNDLESGLSAERQNKFSNPCSQINIRKDDFILEPVYSDILEERFYIHNSKKRHKSRLKYLLFENIIQCCPLISNNPLLNRLILSNHLFNQTND